MLIITITLHYATILLHVAVNERALAKRSVGSSDQNGESQW